MTRPRQPSDLDDDERAALAGLDTQLDAIRARHEHDPPLDLLRAARHDVLPGDLQERVSDHLRDDPWSRALVDGLDSDDVSELDAQAEATLLARIERQSRPVAASRRPWLRYALAGGGLLAASLAVMLRTAPPAAPTPEAPAPGGAAPASAPAASTPAPPPAAAPAAPAAIAVAFTAADVTVSLASLTWRGAAADNPRLVAFRPAFDAYRAGQYRQAATAFAELATVYPDAVEPPFYQGVSLMLAGDFTGAAAALSTPRLATDHTFAAQTAWYLAVAELRLGRVRDARPRLRALCDAGGHAEACAVIPTLPPA